MLEPAVRPIPSPDDDFSAAAAENANAHMLLWLTAERAINGAARESEERAELTRLADEARQQYQVALDEAAAARAD